MLSATFRTATIWFLESDFEQGAQSSILGSFVLLHRPTQHQSFSVFLLACHLSRNSCAVRGNQRYFLELGSGLAASGSAERYKSGATVASVVLLAVARLSAA